MEIFEVLIVEDDPMVAYIHRKFIQSVAGFRVAAVVGDGRQALEMLSQRKIDLAILDIFMPEMDGLELLRKIRAGGQETEVVIVSASRSAGAVQRAMREGVFDYIIKPFIMERIQATLEAFRSIREKIPLPEKEMTQAEIDELFLIRNRKNLRMDLPKGLNRKVLERLEAFLAQSTTPLSAEETACLADVSRVTARRYLEYLVSTGRATMQRSYSGVGRPINRYSSPSQGAGCCD